MTVGSIETSRGIIEINFESRTSEEIAREFNSELEKLGITSLKCYV